MFPFRVGSWERALGEGGPLPGAKGPTQEAGRRRVLGEVIEAGGEAMEAVAALSRVIMC